MECSRKKHDARYLGPNPKGTRLYLGRYRKVPDDRYEINVSEQSMEYSSLKWDSKYCMADGFVRYEKRPDWKIEWKDLNGKNKEAHKDLLQTHINTAMIKAENEEQGKWLSLNLEKRRIRAWIEMLLDFNYRLYITPVEFVEYDEKLYEKLCEIGGDNGCVTLDEKELGPL
eukprot:scaffold10238_cov276-Chaetoceros_neogracile.AAC.2